ncbi:MAG: mfd, partial [Massilia sp.]|nr:mfd [Massilia sp.]
MREVRLLPGREFPMDEAARTGFRSRWRERFEGDPTRSPIYKDIGSGIASAGIEYYLPLFFDQTATLFDYLPEEASLALVGDIDSAIGRFWLDTESRYRFLKSDRERPLLPPGELFLGAEQFFTLAKPHGRWAIAAQAAGDGQASELTAPIPNIAVNRRIEDPLANLRAFLARSGPRVM